MLALGDAHHRRPEGTHAATQQPTVIQARPWWYRVAPMTPSELDQWLAVTGRRPSDPRPRRRDGGPRRRPEHRLKELPGGLGGNQVADTREDLQRCLRHHPLSRLRHLERDLGVLLAPDQIDRAADRRHVVRVVLRQQPHEHVTNHPLGGPVVGGPVPVPHGLHPAHHRPRPSGAACGRRDRSSPSGHGPGAGRRGTPHSTTRSIRSGTSPQSRTATRPPNEWPTSTTRSARTLGSSNSGSRWWAYSSDPQASGGAGVAPNPNRSGAMALTGRSGAGPGTTEHGSKVLVGPPPPVEGQHGGRPRPPSPAEQATAGERLQHRHTLPIASAVVEPSDPSATAPPQVAEGSGPGDDGGDGPDAFERAMGTLTESQHRAVDSTATALCVIAGAGSGKTRVLTLRAAKRIREGSADADHTVICTFTRKAARELRHRLGHYGVVVSTPSGAGGHPALASVPERSISWR